MTAQQIAAPLARLWQGLGQAIQDRAMRRELGQLDDRMLKDLGISRAQAAFEAGSHHPVPGRPWHIGPHHGP